MTPTPDEIRAALDVLGINPDDARNGCLDQCWGQHVASLVDKLDSPDPVPVTKDTPPGTVITHPRISDEVELLWTDGIDLVHRGFTGRPFLGTADGWVEVRRPEPEPRNLDSDTDNPSSVPVRVGQVRAMPVTVDLMSESQKLATLRSSPDVGDFGLGTFSLSTIAGWPVISEPEEAPNE